jgi:hypothetical protein
MPKGLSARCVGEGRYGRRRIISSMAPPIKTLAIRRRLNAVLFLALAVVLVLIEAAGSAALHRTTMASGWLLLALIIGLALYNVRKKLPFLPLGNASTWLQIHIYAGLLSAIVFGMHLQWRVPNGVFETALAMLYAMLFLSGLFGLIASRVFARRLSARGSDVLFGRIQPMRRNARARVERIVIQCMASTESTAVPEYYVQRLKPFFDGPRHFWHHLIVSGRPRRKLLTELQSQDRFLNETERNTMQQIAGYVQQKDDLDFQYAHQVTLKYWLFAHVPLTYAMLAFAVVHVVLVFAFSGAMS